jgi:hypothetical protein
VKPIVFSLALFASLAAGAAFADDAAQNPPPKKGFDPNQIVCKRVEVTDSHLGGQRVCMTWSEWDAQSQADQQALRDNAMRADRPTGAGFGGSAGGSGGMGMHR